MVYLSAFYVNSKNYEVVKITEEKSQYSMPSQAAPTTETALQHVGMAASKLFFTFDGSPCSQSGSEYRLVRRRNALWRSPATLSFQDVLQSSYIDHTTLAHR
jgi:hypothetical protein